MKRSHQTKNGSCEIDLWMTLAATVIATFLIVAATPAHAQTFQVLHSFAGGDDGAIPMAGLIIDAAGNLYGTASDGGKNMDGCETYRLRRRLPPGALRHGLDTENALRFSGRSGIRARRG